ncbi:hypothetical protein SASPL_109753 [Salvia splendens]|uniref:Glycerophosphocholine acyltransferase 1 n=1 Tax=Salvia splendens TaxID=180675 RepID=A0A8X8YKM3_SALSN|nr:hypothetical protein SASPL_109753 [Salvia splendens]
MGSNNEETVEFVEAEDANGNGDWHGNMRMRLGDPSKKVAQTKQMLSKQALQTREILSKQALKIAKQAEEHERFINKVTHLIGVLGFGGFCFVLGARPQDVRYLYCLFYVIFVPLRWIYYRYKKWHYYLLDFCYYANTIFLIMLLFCPRNEKLFMVCFSFAEGPLAWALIVWRCSLVFNSVDKIVSVFIHLLPGTRARILYFLIVDVLRRQRLLRDPEVMTSYRELSKKAQKANNLWWRFSGLLGDQNRLFMYILLQAMFTVATTALTVPIFLSYELHVTFQLLKISASVWNGGNFLLEVMPRQVVMKERKKMEMQPLDTQMDRPAPDDSTGAASSQSHAVESQ